MRAAPEQQYGNVMTSPLTNQRVSMQSLSTESNADLMPILKAPATARKQGRSNQIVEGVDAYRTTYAGGFGGSGEPLPSNSTRKQNWLTNLKFSNPIQVNKEEDMLQTERKPTFRLSNERGVLGGRDRLNSITFVTKNPQTTRTLISQGAQGLSSPLSPVASYQQITYTSSFGNDQRYITTQDSTISREEYQNLQSARLMSQHKAVTPSTPFNFITRNPSKAYNNRFDNKIKIAPPVFNQYNNQGVVAMQERRQSNVQFLESTNESTSISTIGKIVNITAGNSSTTVDTIQQHPTTAIGSKRNSKSQAFKRLRVGKDLKEIEKWLDEKEMSMEDLRTSLVGNNEPFSQENDFIFFQEYSVFFSAFKETQQIISNQQSSEVQQLMSRIQAGLHHSFTQFKERLQMVRKHSGEVISKLSVKLERLTAEFKEYKASNDLDTYFESKLSRESRKRVMSEIKELFRRAKEEELVTQYDEKILEQLHFSNATQTLDEVQYELDFQIQEKIAFFKEDAEREAYQAQHHTNDNPLPPVIFKQQLDDKAKAEYSKACGRTTNKVTKTLLDFFHRDYSTVECQTLSFEEFEAQFKGKIDQLETMLKAKTDQRKIIESDIERMQNQLAYLSMERATRAQDLDMLEKKYMNTKNMFDSKNAEIDNLTVQLKQEQKKVMQLDSANFQLREELEQLSASSKSMRRELVLMQAQEAESMEKVTNEVNLRLAFEKRCKEMQEELEIEGRKRKGFEQIKEGTEMKIKHALLCNILIPLIYLKQSQKCAFMEYFWYICVFQQAWRMK